MSRGTQSAYAASISTNSLGSENGDWIIKSASLALCSDDHARSIAAPEYQSRQSLIRRIFPDHAARIEQALSGLTATEQREATQLLRKLGLSAAADLDDASE